MVSCVFEQSHLRGMCEDVQRRAAATADAAALGAGTDIELHVMGAPPLYLTVTSPVHDKVDSCLESTPALHQQLLTFLRQCSTKCVRAIMMSCSVGLLDCCHAVWLSESWAALLSGISVGQSVCVSGFRSLLGVVISWSVSCSCCGLCSCY